MSSKFFTNQGTNKLVDKININLKTDKNITNLDFLVGYIRMSGLENIIENMEGYTSRILVGLKSDDILYKASNIKDFAKEQIDDLMDKYNLVENIIRLIDEKKLEIYITKERNVHAKMYIFRNDGTTKDHEDNINYQGSLIIGSSNLTYNGLEKSYELNTEIKENNYIVDGVEVFDNLWKDAVPLTADDIDKHIKPFIKKPKLSKSTSTCSDIFHKSLIEYFGNIVENRLDLNSDTKLFTYQKDAVLSAIFRINKYNGVILGDVVGLGKTVIAVGVLQILKERVLIIAPPAIHKQWRDTLKDFHITDYALKSFEDKSLNENSKNDYKIVLIDESHKLKNEKSKRYKKIEKICKEPFRKKVILLSATLQNNSPLDIANQIYLFQDKNNSNIPNIVSLGNFFTPHILNFKALKENKDKEVVTNSLKAISKDIKEKVLKHLLIRRTRDDIESHDMYKVDIDKFPNINIAKPLTYKLGSMKNDFKITVHYLENILEFNRFKVLNNLNTKGQDKYKKNNPTMSDNIFDKNDLSTLAKYSLIKRFESSFEAFFISIENAISTIEFFIKDLENNKLYVGKDSTKYLNREGSKREYIYDGTTIYYVKKNEKKVTLKGTIFSKNDFIDSEKYLEDLEVEKKYLIELKNIWEINRKKSDPKKEVFIKELNKKKSHKIVVFTEYTDTLSYLEDTLPQYIKDKTLFITSQNRKVNSDKIAYNFDANIDKKQQDNIYQFIITTDTLAEGVNLHRSDTLFNYDLPWNSTKLMQRMGRINRIGTKFDELNIYNFKPTDESNNIIGLLEKSFLKLQSFHYTLGEDSKILFDEEVVESFGLQKDGDEELKYLNIIREFKKNSPTLYEKLKKQDSFSVENINNDLLLLKAHVELSFFKINDISYMYKKENEIYNGIDFITFIEYIQSLKEYGDTASHVEDSIKYHIDKINLDKATKFLHVTKTKSEKEAIILLKVWLQDDKIIDSALYTTVEKLIKDRVSSSIAKEILSLSNEEPSKIVESLKLFSKNIKSVIVLDTKKVDSKLYALV